MGKTIVPARSSVKAIIYINDVPVAGQIRAVLDRSMKSIDITNQIKKDWQRNLAGTRQWSLTCSGLVIIDEAGFIALEEAFMQGTQVHIKLENSENEYEGNALITSFPIEVQYDKEYVYNVKFLGTGALE